MFLKLSDTVRLVCKQESGELLQLDKLASEKTGVMEKTSAMVLAVTYLHDPPPVICCRCTKKCLF